MKVLYTKFNRERLPIFQIMTQVYEENGRIYSRKKALTGEACGHIHRIGENTLFCNGRVIRSSDDEVVLEFNRNTSLTTLLINALKNNDDDGFRKIIRDYVRFMYRSTERDNIFIQTDEFVNVFGYLERPLKNINYFQKSNVDMSFDNLFANLNYKGNSPRFESIDCEWVFDFKVPVEYVIFRSILCFSNEYRCYLNEYPLERLFEIAGVRVQNLRNYWSFEKNFSKYVFGENNIYVNRQYYKEIKSFYLDKPLSQWELKAYVPDCGYLETNVAIKMIEFSSQPKIHTLKITRPVNGKFRVDFGNAPAAAVIKSIKISKLNLDGEVSYYREFSKENGFDGIILGNGIFELDKKESISAIFYNNDPFIIIDDDIESQDNEHVLLEFEMYVNDKFDESVVMLYQRKIMELMDTQRNEYSKSLLELNEKHIRISNQYYALNHEYNLTNVKNAELESEVKEWNVKFYTLNHQYNLATFRVTELEGDLQDVTSKYLTVNHEKNLSDNQIVELKAQIERESVAATNEKLRLNHEINLLNQRYGNEIATLHQQHADEINTLHRRFGNEIALLTQRLDETETENENLSSSIRIHEYHKLDMEKSINELEQALRFSNETISKLQESMNQVYNSGSWKLTKPYRAVKRIITGKK